MAEFKSIGREKYGLALSEFLHRVILYTLNEEKLLNVAGLLNWEDKKRAKKA
jgi:hypothetical protein